MIYLLEKQEQDNPKFRRRKKLVKIRAKINKMKTKRIIQSIDEIKCWFFERINQFGLTIQEIKRRCILIKLENKKVTLQ
jgi:hypothetical protein